MSIEKSKEYQELQAALASVGSFIKSGRRNLASSNPNEIVETLIPDSTLELNASISASEDASNEIMDACDAIEKAVAGLDEVAKQAVLAETAKIFSSCGFQDITGQRATKVISYLAQVEEKTLVLIKSLKGFFDKEGTPAQEDTPKGKVDEDHELTDEELKNGPQLEGKGLSQAEVDAMLNDF